MKLRELKLNVENTSILLFFLILLLPFVKYYEFPLSNVSIETFMKIIIFVLCFIISGFTKNKEEDKSLKKSKHYFRIFCIWVIIVTVFFELFTNININNPYSNYTLSNFILLIPTMYSLYVLLEGKMQYNGIFKIYERFIFLVVIIYIIQIILLFFNTFISFKIPFLNFSSSYDYLNGIIFGMNGQATSLFSEKAHMCEFILPYLTICLFSNNYKNNIFKAIIISVILISTMSGNGIVTLFIEWMVYLVFLGKIKSIIRVALIFLLPFVLIILYNYLLTIPTFNRMSKELFINTTGKYTQTKADYRVYRGFDYYFQLPFVEKITGVGYSHMKVFSKEYDISSKYDVDTVGFEFFSTTTQVLLYSGLIGFIFWGLHLFMIWKSKSNLVKALLIMSIAIWFSSQMLFAESYYIYILLIIAAFVSFKKEEVIKHE